MKKVLIMIAIIILFIPLNQSNKNIIVDEVFNLPSKEDIMGFLNSLHNKIKIPKFYEESNLIEDIVVITGNPEYIVKSPLEDAIEEYYEEIGIEYDEELVNDFVESLNLSTEIKNAIAIILFSYINFLNSENFNDKIDNLLLLFNNVRKASYYLKDYEIKEDIYDPYGRMMLGGYCDSESNVSFIIDFGGNDSYRNNSFILDLKGEDKYTNENAIIFDLEGDDEYNDSPCYESITFFFDLEGNDKYNGEIASSYDGGVSILIDIEGNDVYKGENYTQAYSYNAISVLIDVEGDDFYYAKSYSQCCSFAGISLLVDFYGNDVFIANNSCQSFANEKSLSLFANLEGDDFYKACSYSQGFGKNFGVAVLFDFTGNDSYKAMQYSQSSSFGGLAAFLDAEGKNKIKGGLFSKGFKFGGISIFMNNFEIEGNEEIFEILNELNINLRDFFSYIV